MRRTVALLLTYALALAPLAAQAPPPAQTPSTGVVHGIAKSNTGRRLEGLTIQIRNAAGAVVGSMVTKDDGAYRFAGLGAGPYVLECLTEDKDVIETEKLTLVLPDEAEDITCAHDALLPWFNRSVITALAAAVAAAGAVGVVATGEDGSPSQ